MTQSDDDTAVDDQDYSQDYTDEAATFGDRIAAARDAMGMSAAQLAKRLGVKLQTLQGWEHDRAEPRANKLQMLAGVLNVSMMWLMTGRGEGFRTVGPSVESAELQTVLAELRDIRMRQNELSDRTLKLEQRLVALLREAPSC